MIFSTMIRGIACKCKVEQITPFKFTLLDKHGFHAPRLQYLTKDEKVIEQMIEEYQIERMDEYYNPY